MDKEPRQVRSDEARTRFRALLNAVEHDGEHITILRYDEPAAVLVPVEWHREALAALDARNA
jgi:prevent-host-death family protein